MSKQELVQSLRQQKGGYDTADCNNECENPDVCLSVGDKKNPMFVCSSSTGYGN